MRQRLDHRAPSLQYPREINPPPTVRERQRAVADPLPGDGGVVGEELLDRRIVDAGFADLGFVYAFDGTRKRAVFLGTSAPKQHVGSRMELLEQSPVQRRQLASDGVLPAHVSFRPSARPHPVPSVHAALRPRPGVVAGGAAADAASSAEAGAVREVWV